MRLLLAVLLATASLSAAEPTPLETAKKLFGESRYADARAILEKLSTAEPQNAEAAFYLGWTAFRLNQPEAAVPFVEKAVALDGTKALWFHVLGDAYGVSAQRASVFSKMGLAKKCIAAYDRAVALDPSNISIRKTRYDYYRQAPSFIGGGMDKALAEAQEIEKLDPVLGGGLRADLRHKDGHTDEAFALHDELIRRFPESKVARFQLGRLAAMTGQRLDDGAAALRDYLSYSPQPIEPPLWAAHWRLAQILEAKGDIAAARAEYEETLKLNPNFDRARDALQKLK